MSNYVDPREAEGWSCAKCGIALELQKVEVAYRGSKYPVILPRCPKCGLVFIPEGLALGKMAEVQKLLEDK